MTGIASKGSSRVNRYRTPVVVASSLLLLVALAAFGVGIAPAAASDDGEHNNTEQNNTIVINANESGNINATFGGAQTADVDLRLTVEEDVKAPSGTKVSIDLNIAPVQEEEVQIDWFEVRLEFDNSKLAFNNLEGSQVGGVDVTGVGADYVEFENGYELGDFFIDPAKAPLTLATVEFVVFGDSGEAYVRPDPDNTVTGWGFGWTSISEHSLWYEGGYIEILDASDLGTVEGTVTNEQGDPVEGVQIAAANAPGSTETDANGEYQLFVPEGPAMLQAAHPDELVNVTETAVVETGSTTQQNLTLKPYDRGDADVTLTAADHRAGKGQTIEVPLYAFDRGWSQEGYSNGIRGMGAQVEYDPAVLEFVDASGGVENLGKVNKKEDGVVYLEGQSAQEYHFDSPPWQSMSPYHMATVQFRVVGSDGDTSPVNIVYDESAIAYASPDDGGPYWPGSEELGNPAGEVVVAGEADVGTATVEGTVTDQDGEPVGNADVKLANDDGAGATTTNSDGTYTLEVTGFENPDHVIAFDGGASYKEVVTKEITAKDGESVTVDAQLQAADAAVEVDVGADGNYAQNERITVPIVVEEGSAGVPDEASETGALGYNFLFNYSTDVLEFVSAESIAFEATQTDTDDLVISDIDPENSAEYGQLRVQSMDPADSAFPRFIAVNVTFDVVGDAGDQTDLKIVPQNEGGEALSGVSHTLDYVWPAVYDQGSVTVGDEQVSNDRGTVTGTVTDTEGNPIEGVKVAAGGVSAKTGADGTYEFEVSNGTYDLTASHKEYSEATVEIDVTKDQTTQQDIELEQRDVWIEVNATDAEGGQGAIVTVPIEVTELSSDWQDVADYIVGYELFLDYDTDVLEFAGAQDADFSVEGVRTEIPESDPGYGLGELRLNSSSIAETAEPPLTPVKVNFELVGDPGDNSTIEIISENEDGESVSGISHDPNFGAWPAVYETGTVEITDEDVAFGTLELAVTDQDGNPVPGAAVTGGGVDETTDSDGQISVELQSGTYDLTVEAEGESARTSVEITGDSTTRESVELPLGGDDGGDDDDNSSDEPATGLTFEAVNSGGLVSFNTADKQTAKDKGVKFPVEGMKIEATIDEEAGTWESTNTEFESFEAKGQPVEVTAPNGLHGEFDAENDRMTFEGEFVVNVADVADVRFSIEATTGSSGSIEGKGNIGDEDGSVLLVDNEFTVAASGNNLVDGKLGLPSEEAGTNWFVFPLDFDLTEVEVDDGGGGDGGTADGTGTLQGEILDQNGEPIENAIVSVDGQFQEKLTDRNGQFEVTLPAGTYTVEVEAEGYESETYQAEVVGGETMSVSGVLAGGEPAIETTVRTTAMDDGSVKVEGTVENVGAGTASQEVELSFGGESTTETVQVGAGESKTVSAEFSVDDPEGTQAEVSAGEDTATTTYSASGQEGDDGEAGDGGDGSDGGPAGNETVLRAVGQGGFIAFANDSTEEIARSGGLEFPSKAENDSFIEFRAVVDEENGTWEATDYSFPVLNVNDNLAASVEAPNGLSGEIDTETGRMTMSGTFRVTVLDRPSLEPNSRAEPFEFEMNLVSGSSGSMTGSASFENTSGYVELVDNQYIIDDSTDNALIDGDIGLPSTDAGTNWLKLNFDVEIEEGADPDQGGDLGGEDDKQPEKSQEEGGTFLSAFGQLLGLVGVAAGLILVIFGLGKRFVGAVDPDPGK